MTPIYNFMASARKSLDMTMYELSDSAAEQILVADHNRGIKVRVLLDEKYNGGSVNQIAYSMLHSAGVPVAWANDSEIFHQKTITVDGHEAAVMTGNLTSQYYVTTRDFVVMDSQSADVAAIESVFGTDWSGAAPSPGPAGVDVVWSPGSQSRLDSLIRVAAHSVVVENEEMDSTDIEDALQADARRGVDVTVVMTANSEWDSALSSLESAGVHVVRFPGISTALYIHAKVIDVDNTTAFLGSENFSTASLDYNRELGLITTAKAVLGPLNSTLASDIVSPQAQRSSAASTAPPTTPGGQMATGRSCTASMSNATPGDSGNDTVNVSSNVPNAPVTVTKHYKTTTSTDSGTTNGSGAASITFGIGHPSIGYAVQVDVDIGNGAATCSTSFTPQ